MHLLPLRQLVHRHGHRRGHRAADHHGLVLADEARLRLHRGVRLGFGVGDAELHLLAEDALGGVRRDLADQFVAGVDVLDRQFVALQFVLARHRVGAGARQADPDEHGGAGDAGGPAAERRLDRPAQRHGPARSRPADRFRPATDHGVTAMERHMDFLSSSPPDITATICAVLKRIPNLPNGICTRAVRSPLAADPDGRARPGHGIVAGLLSFTQHPPI